MTDGYVRAALSLGGRSVEVRVTFLEQGIIHVVADPTGAFAPYATPRAAGHVARIQAQPDDSARYAHPEVLVQEADGALAVSSGAVELTFEDCHAEKDGPRLVVRVGGRPVLREAAPLRFAAADAEGDGGGFTCTQTLACAPDERFFGGGTQNGRVEHAGSAIRIENANKWVDGEVSSPSPFFWSSAGYGVLRNTFARGTYDFGAATPGQVSATHEDGVYDAYLFVAVGAVARLAAGGADADDSAGAPRLREVARELLAAYYHVTGKPVLLPLYAFYLGHLNAYNRDAWSEAPTGEADGKAWAVRGSLPAEAPGRVRYEYGRVRGYVVPAGHAAESLNGPDEVLTASAENYLGVTPYAYSARAVVDEYAENDMQLGWILPNDGYGAGYGHNGYQVTGGVGPDGTSSPERLTAVAANVENLASFSAYARKRGVETGLWTMSDLVPVADPDVTWQNLRDFRAEVTRAGVTTLKTDEEWVGSGYSFGLNGTKQAYDTVSRELGRRPNVVTLDGWAGTQRFGAVWTGDQNGDDWEYIRLHVPTYLGQGMAGNPNVGSDMDGIYGGDALVATRDYEWKAFTPLMLDMDGWGSTPKRPHAAGDPHTGIRRMYLKLKSQLMPYLYTTAASAALVDGWEGNGDLGLPMLRPTFLADEAPEAVAAAARYQFLLGDSLLVAPIYQDTRADADGNDVRDAIFLPGTEKDLWLDFFTGEAYPGGQVLDGFDAPLWKLPVFVRAGAILPRWEAHNNPRPVSTANPGGLDRTRRAVDFYPAWGAGVRAGVAAAGAGAEGAAVETRYVAYEDDGSTLENRAFEEPGYGLVDDVSYGGHVSAAYACRVEGRTVTLAVEPLVGEYVGFDPVRATTLRARVPERPARVRAACGGRELALREACDRAAFDAAEPGTGEAVWLFEEAPALEMYAPAEERAFLAMVAGVHGAPRVSVRFPRADVRTCDQRVTIELREPGAGGQKSAIRPWNVNCVS